MTTCMAVSIVKQAYGNTIENGQDEARIQFENGDLIGAIETWNRQLIEKPGLISAQFNRALAYIVLGEYEMALKDLDQLIATSPERQSRSSIGLLRGVALASMGKHLQAVQEFDQAWKIGKNPSALANKAMSINSLGQTKKAYELMKQVVVIDPTTANYYKQATLEKELGQYEACIKSLNTIIQSEKMNAPAYALRGRCRSGLKQNESAMADLLRSQSLAASDPETLMTIGTLLRQSGKDDEALKWILKAASIYLSQHKRADYEEALKEAKQLKQPGKN